MDATIKIVELIFFILATISMLLIICVNIQHIINEARQNKRFNKALNEFSEKISNAIIECEKKEIVKENKKTPDYNKMSIGELKKVAKNLKIKGYYNLHKNELIKAIQEAM